MVASLCFEVCSYNGMWAEARKNITMTSSMPMPRDEVPVRILSIGERKWQVHFSGSTKGVDMVAEDIAQVHKLMVILDKVDVSH